MTETSGLDLPDILGKVDAAVLAHHPDTGEILAANRRAAELYRRPIGELVGLYVDALTSDEPGYTHEEALERIRAAADGDPQEFEWLNERRDGDRYWVQVHLERATVDGRDVVLGTVTDVTEFKEREERMQLLYRVLRHNLRNDMNLVSGNAEVVRDALADDAVDGSVVERLERIRAKASKVAALSERVADLERAAQAGAQDPEERELSAMLAEVAGRVRGHHHDVRVDVETTGDCVVAVDDVFVCALEQLVDNAIEHGAADDGGVEVRARPNGDGETVDVMVVDEGPGIPGVETAVLDTSADQSALRHGSGLGLWVAKWAVDAHDGTLAFADRDDGTTVHVRAPIAADG